MTEYLGLDFETYSACDLKKHGLFRYVKDPSFRPLLASLTQEDYAGNIQVTRLDFVLDGIDACTRELAKMQSLTQFKLVAHNAPFEKAVLHQLGIHIPARRFVDSAVVARAAGAAGKLEAAAPQLLNVNKMASGADHIKLFSIPGKYQEKHDTRDFVPDVVREHPDEWSEFGEYCDLDSLLGLRIVQEWGNRMTQQEWDFAAITLDMNFTGWPVDVELVEEMNRRYKENQVAALEAFRQSCNAPDLNLNSLPQQKAWCEERGVKARSFDEKTVAKMLKRIESKIDTMSFDDSKLTGSLEVASMLKTKQVLGGSSLKKLDVILNTVDGNRLRDQYLHIGAGQSWRTTGRSAQLQNLKRIGENPDPVDELIVVPDVEWDNSDLARNIRQVFTASDPDGFLLVGDFKSVESRKLAWLAGEEWKLEAYRQGLDVYKVQAQKIYQGIAYDAVTKEQRQTGKVGELSCGYQAGGGAVQAFAENMGVELTEGEATKLVSDWRLANPKIVDFWEVLDSMLHGVVEGTLRAPAVNPLPDGFRLEIHRIDMPESLRLMHPNAQSIEVRVLDPRGSVFMRRYFHGCYLRGNSICYYKPSELKSGDLWRRQYTDPKTGQLRYYSIYGGKLAGILTQSFCREHFMRALRQVALWCEQREDQLSLIGQFHDEIVVDWIPAKRGNARFGALTLEAGRAGLRLLMSDPGAATTFPLDADVKFDYRYTK
jgi:DNA polymerase